jgi:hypothetical protein
VNIRPRYAIGVIPRFLTKDDSVKRSRDGGMMGKNGQPTAAAVGPSGTLESANLATDLNALVDRLEVDWRSNRLVSRDAARQLHDLRAKAERLFDKVA